MEFDRWLKEQKPPEPRDDSLDYEHLGAWKREGKWMIACRVCERDFEMFTHPSEYLENDNYCGGSPRCCP